MGQGLTAVRYVVLAGMILKYIKLLVWVTNHEGVPNPVDVMVGFYNLAVQSCYQQTQVVKVVTC